MKSHESAISKVLLASRKELAEAYKLAVLRGDLEEALFWRTELLQKTVQILNLHTKE